MPSKNITLFNGIFLLYIFIYLVPCTTGTWFNGHKCELCPTGTYQDMPGESECKKCPSKMTTYKSGSTVIEDCVGKKCDSSYVLIVHSHKYFPGET